MKRTTIVVDEKLVKAGLKVTGLKTQRDLIDFALRQLIGLSKQNDLLQYRGEVVWEGNLKESRKGRDSYKISQ